MSVRVGETTEKLHFLRGVLIGDGEENRPKALLFLGKHDDKKKFESANDIVEKFCCHRAES